MTSDGISQEDWDGVGDLAAEIVNASSAGDQVLDESLTEALLDHLNDLEGKYGGLPSILATEADYVSDVQEKIALLERAYEAAKAKTDHKNKTLVSSSLSEFYITELKDYASGRFWLRELRESLSTYWDDWEASIYDELSKLVHKGDD